MAKEKKTTSKITTTVSFKETLELIPLVHAGAKKLVPLLIGSTGIGKTELVKQLAAAQNKDIIILHMSQMEPADFLGLPQVRDGLTVNCAPNWLPRADKINPNGGYVFLDEPNRASEDMRQAFCQLLQDKKIHTYSLPEGYDVIAAMNPCEGGYETYEFDKAIMQRFFPINFCPKFDEVIDYLETKSPSHPMLGWVRTDGALVDFEAAGDGVLLTPRNLEMAMGIWELGKDKSEKFQRIMLEGVMPSEKVAHFLAYMEELRHINIKDIIKGDNMVKLDQLFKDNRKDILFTLSRDLAKFLDEEIGDISKTKHPLFKDKQSIINIAKFVERMPGDAIGTFIDYFNPQSYSGKCTILHHPDFKAIVKAKAFGLNKALREVKDSK